MDKSFDLNPLVDSLSNFFARRLGLNRSPGFPPDAG